MQAVAQALVKRGHSVVWLTSADNEARVKMTGATFVATQDIAAIDAPLMAENATGLLDKVYSRLKSRVLAQVSDYRRVLATFAVDVLLVDVMPHGARVLYELGEIPVYATLGVIPMYMSNPQSPHPVSGAVPPTSLLGLLWNGIRHAWNQWVVMPLFLKPVIDRQRRQLGLGALPYGEAAECFTYSPHLHIQASSPTLEFLQRPKPKDQQLNTHFVGPLVTSVPNSADQLPSWWDEAVAHPRVVGITQGTLAMDPTSLILPAIEALVEDKSLLLVVATPHSEDLERGFGDRPNVRFAKWLPYHVLLPQLRLLITNGGYGSITQALSHGVPLICAGQTEDKKDTAARVMWSRVGIDLKTDSPSASEVQVAARRILDDDGYRNRAAQLGEDLNGLGGANRACDLLEDLVESRLKTDGNGDE